MIEQLKNTGRIAQIKAAQKAREKKPKFHRNCNFCGCSVIIRKTPEARWQAYTNDPGMPWDGHLHWRTCRQMAAERARQSAEGMKSVHQNSPSRHAAVGLIFGKAGGNRARLGKKVARW